MRTRLICMLAMIASSIVAQQPEPESATRTVAVRVLDSRGKPAVGVPLVAGAVGTLGSSLTFDKVKGSRAVTDAEGRATLTVTPRNGRGANNLHVQADVIAEPPVRVPVPNGDDDEVVVRLPRMGQVRVLVYGADEKPLSGVGGVRLEVAGTKRFFDRLSVRGEAEDEGAMFRWVGLGLKLSVRASIKGIGKLHVEHDGPVNERQLVVMDVRANAQSIVRVSLVDADGKPLANRKLVSILSVGERRTVFDSKTNAEGRLSLPVPKLFAGKHGATWWLCDPSNQGAALGVPLHPAFAGFRDVENAKLTPGGVAMRGKVVDSSGKPLPGVELRVPLSQISGSRFLEQRSSVAEHVVRTDEDGVFEVREHEFREGRVGVEVGNGLLLTTKFVKYGNQDLELEALRAGRLRIVLPNVPVGCDAAPMQVLRRNRGPGNFGFGMVLEDKATLPLPDGVALPEGCEVASMVEFEDLEHGTYDVYLGSGPRAKGLPSNLQVGEPEVGGATMTTFDCSKHLIPVTPRLIGPNGKPTEGWLMVYTVGPGGFGGRSIEVGAESGAVLVPKGDRFVFKDPKWRSVEVRKLAAKVDIQLQPRFPVEFAVPEGLDLPAGIRIEAMPKMLEWMNDGTVTLLFDPKQPMKADFDAAGKAVVTFAVPNGSSGEYREVLRADVVIPEPQDDKPVRVELPLTKDDVAKLR